MNQRMRWVTGILAGGLMAVAAGVYAAAPEGGHPPPDDPVAAPPATDAVAPPAEAPPSHGGDAGAHGEGRNESEGLLAVDIRQLLTQTLAFLLVFLILKKFAWKPVLGMLETREKRVKGDLDGAERARKESEANLVEQKRLLAESREEARRIIERAKAGAEHEKAAIVDAARKEAGGTIARAKEAIGQAEAEATARLLERVSELSVDIAARILERELAPADRERMLSRGAEEFGKRMREERD
ncbi:MAG: F0F1 ATP synthase subunit B [Planctomycetota bacterium]